MEGVRQMHTDVCKNGTGYARMHSSSVGGLRWPINIECETQHKALSLRIRLNTP